MRTIHRRSGEKGDQAEKEEKMSFSYVYNWPDGQLLKQRYRKVASREEALAIIDRLRLDGFRIRGWVLF